MCGRTSCTLCPDDIKKACSYHNKTTGKFQQPDWKSPPEDSSYDYKPSHNLAPTEVIPVLVDGFHCSSDAERVIKPMIWGIIPPWHKEKDPKSHKLSTFNCRLESMVVSKLYSKIFKDGQRCIILCDGFYEWQTTKGKATKQPYFIYAPQPGGVQIEDPDTWNYDWNEETGWKGPNLLKMAGIFGKWTSSEGEELFSCSVITREANETLSWLHHRMPVILDNDEQVSRWLSSNKIPSEDILKELVPAKLLQYHPVSTQVNNSRYKDTDCNKPITLQKPKEKKSASSVFMEQWLKKSNSPIKRETNDDSPDVKRIKVESNN